MTDETDETDVIFHLTTPEAWASAQATGEVVPPGFATEGFVHCSTPHQVEGTIARHFAGHDELALLQMDPVALGEDLRWEPSRGGQLFPHLYRPVRVADVVAVVPWLRSTTTDHPASDDRDTSDNPE